MIQLVEEKFYFYFFQENIIPVYVNDMALSP